MVQRNLDLGRPRLRIPQPELHQVEPGALLHCPDEILAGRRLTVVATEIEIGPGAEPLFTRHCPHHADDFGALVVNGGSIEIGDFAETVGPDRMRQRAAVFRELRRTQHPHILDPFHRFALHVLAEKLVAQHGEAFFQAQLEPVAAGDPVARPVVEILMRNDAFDSVEIGVCRSVGISKDILRVEDVEALVLHRPHVEIADGHDVEQVEIVFAAEHLFVPFHALFQRFERVVGARQVFVADPDIQFDLAAGYGGKGPAIGDKIARNQCKEVTRLGPWVVPLGPVGAIVTLPFGNLVAVAQQDRELRLGPAHTHRIGGKHIGAVGEEAYAAEALSLALGAQHPARGIKAH